MYCKFFGFLFVFYLLNIFYSVGQSNHNFELNATIQKSYIEITKMKLNAGKALLLNEKKNHNAWAYYLEGYADMIQLLVAEDLVLYERFIKNQEIRYDLIENMDSKSPHYNFLLAELKIQNAFVKLKFGHELKGSTDIIKAYKLLEKNALKFPYFIPNQKTLGLLHVLIGSTPESYLWVANLLGLNGSIKKGISELENVVNKDAFYRDEAQLMLFLIQAYILKINAVQLQNFQKFVAENPDNQLFHFFLCSVLMKEGKANTALELIEKSTNHYPFPIIDYLKGEIYLQKGMYLQAKICYNNFLRKHQGINFIKDSNYKLFLCYWLNNEDAKGLVYLENVEFQGRTIVESDKSALKFAKSFLLKNSIYKNKERVLMKARLAFDGGLYSEAKQILHKWNEINFELKIDKAEFNYRKGRISQKLLETSTAIVFFERAIELSNNQEYAFGALSALQIGSIYQEKGMKETAKLYYKKAISFKNHEYKNSTDNKAKAALNEMGYR